MSRIKDSAHWTHLLRRYAHNPSIALCRVPELEMLSGIELRAPVLDHCCGDGYIAAHAYPGRVIEEGIDLRERALQVARASGAYQRVQRADASLRLPFEDASFETLINNSAIEHIEDLDAVLAQVARVLRPGGRFHFNVLNSRFFEWWPLGAETQRLYRAMQPFYHALDEETWTRALARHGLTDTTFHDFMPRPTAEVLAEYDYRFSAFYLRRRPSWRVLSTLMMPASMLRRRWQRLFGELSWNARPGTGAGFLVSATRR